MYQTLSLRDLPSGDRFAFWWEAVARSVVPVHASSEDAQGFWAEMASVQLGQVQISRVRCLSFHARRTPQLIRRSDPDLYQLSLTLRGRSGLEQEDRQASLAPTDLVLYDTSLPFQAWTVPDGTADGIVVQFPRDTLPLPHSAVRRLTARRLPGGIGTGALLATVLRQTLLEAQALSATDAARLSTVVTELVAAVMAREIESDAAAAPCTRLTMLLRVQDYMIRNLGDPKLSPTVIAKAHNMSVRSLHRLFAEQDTTVSEWIRTRRLEQCRRELADPHSRRHPIRVTGARWGYPDPANFTRAFRTAYGISPREYRRREELGEARSRTAPE